MTNTLHIFTDTVEFGFIHLLIWASSHSISKPLETMYFPSLPPPTSQPILHHALMTWLSPQNHRRYLGLLLCPADAEHIDSSAFHEPREVAFGHCCLWH